MDNLKFIQVQNEDGTLGQKVPIGADAANVTLSSGVNLQTAVVNINNDIDDLETQMSDKAAADDVEDLDGRVTTIQNTIGDASSGQTLTGRISSLQNRADNFQGQITILQAQKASIEQVNNSLNSLESELQNEINQKPSQSYVDNIESQLSDRIDEISSQIDESTAQQLSNLVYQVNDLQDDVDDINSGMEAYQTSINTQVQNLIDNYDNVGMTTLFEATDIARADTLIGIGSSATLSASVTNFDYIEVYSFHGNNNVIDILPVDTNLQSEGYSMRWLNVPDANVDRAPSINLIETKLAIKETTASIQYQAQVYHNASGWTGTEVSSPPTTSQRSLFGIVKIVGVKRTGNAAVTNLTNRVVALENRMPVLTINSNGIVRLG